MASLVKTAGASMALAGTMMSGCMTSKTVDDELLPFARSEDGGASAHDAAPAPAPALADAGSTAAKCASSDPITQLLCQLTTPANSAQPQQAATPDLTGLLDSLGGLANIATILGPIVGTTPTRVTTPTSTQSSGLVDLVNLAGGLANIAQLFNQLLSGQSLLSSLFNGGAQTMQPASVADVLTGLGIPVAGPDTTLAAEPTESECANPTTPQQEFACALQRAQ